MTIQTLLKLLRKQWPKTLCEVNHKNAYQLDGGGDLVQPQSADKAVNEITPGLFQKYPTPQAMARKPIRPTSKKMIHRAGFFRRQDKKV